MGGHIGALGHETHVAEVALIDHLPVFRFLDAIEFAGGAFVDEVK